MRRLLFFVALIATGAVTTTLFRYFHPPGVVSHPAGVYFWGAGSIHLVLAFWLAARKPLWSDRYACLRATIYVIAFFYGWMLYRVVQDAQTIGVSIGYRLPGARYQDYIYPLFVLPLLLTLTLMTRPLVFFLGLSLGSPTGQEERNHRFSLRDMLTYTTLMGVLLGWVVFLTSPSAPSNGISGMSPTHAVGEWIEQASFQFIYVGAGFIVLWAMSKSWIWAFLSFPVAITACGIAATVLVSLLAWMTGNLAGGVHSDRGINLWAYVAGNITTFWTAFAVARLLGVRATFSSPRTQISEN